MRRARYRIVDDTDYCLIIRDLGPWDKHPTVTNDAENVVAELATLLGHRKLYYFDSENDLDELVVVNGRFAGFTVGPRS